MADVLVKTGCSPAAAVLAKFPHGMSRICFVSWFHKSLKRLCSARFQKRAAELCRRARSMSIPFSELSGSPSRRIIAHDPDAESSQRSLSVAMSNGDDADQAGGADEEAGLPVATRKATWLNMKKIAECRERSQSAWLHFPHVELVFLLFAFEGAVAAQVAAVREASSPLVFTLAIATLVSLLGGFADMYCCWRSNARSSRLIFRTQSRTGGPGLATVFGSSRPQYPFFDFQSCARIGSLFLCKSLCIC